MDNEKGGLQSNIHTTKWIPILVWLGILFPSIIKAGTSRFSLLLIQLIALALLWLSFIFCIRNKGCSLSYHQLDLLFIIFPVLAAFSTLFVHYKHHAQMALLLVISFCIFYFHLAEYFSIHDLEKLWWGFIGLGIFESIVGLFQFLFKNEYRVTGTFYNPNHLAGLLACLLMVLLARLVFNPSFRHHIPLKISIIVFFGIVIVLTRSRGGLLALIGGSIGFAFFIKSIKKAFPFLIVAIILLLIIPNPIMNRIKDLQTTDVYAYSRLSMWKSALKMLGDHPVLGIGIGNFGYVSYRYAFPVEGAWARYARIAKYAHNECLHLGAEMGIPGLLFFLLAVIMIFSQLFKGKTPPNDSLNSGMDQKALLIGIITLLAHSSVDFIFHIPPLVFLMLLLITRIRNSQKKSLFYLDLSYNHLKRLLFISLLVPILIAWIPVRQYLGFVIQRKAEGEDLHADISYLENAAKIDFGCADYHNSLGGAYFKLFGFTHDPHDLKKGLKEAELAQILNPDDHRFPLSLGQGYLNLYLISRTRNDMLEKAEREFKDCLKLAPYLYEGFLGLGQVYFYQNRKMDALNTFKDVVKLEPYSMAGHYWLGLTLETIGDSEAAQTEYQKILEIKDLELEKKAYITYEKALIDFDLRNIYPKLRSGFRNPITEDIKGTGEGDG